MDVENKNLNSNLKNNNPIQHHPYEELKIHLIKRYNISSQEAEKVIEKRLNEKRE